MYGCQGQKNSSASSNLATSLETNNYKVLSEVKSTSYSYKSSDSSLNDQQENLKLLKQELYDFLNYQINESNSTFEPNKNINCSKEGLKYHTQSDESILKVYEFCDEANSNLNGSVSIKATTSTTGQTLLNFSFANDFSYNKMQIFKNSTIAIEELNYDTINKKIISARVNIQGAFNLSQGKHEVYNYQLMLTAQ